MTKLTAPQHKLLALAAQADGAAIEAPGGATATVTTLIKRGLLISVPQAKGASLLLITEAGRASIEADLIPAPQSRGSDPMVPDAALEPKAMDPRPKGKIGLLINLVPCRMKRSNGRIRITDAAGKPLSQTPRRDDTLISALRGAHTALAEAAKASIGMPEQAILDVAPPSPYVRNLMRLAFLAPHIQAQILEGRQPIGLNRQRLILGKIPLAWADQRRAFETG